MYNSSATPLSTLILAWTVQAAIACVEEALTHRNCKLIANGLGASPDHVVKMEEDSGGLIGAL